MSDPRWVADVDAVVVGSGVAGLTCALELAGRGLSVLVVTKAELEEGNTRYAQGGIAVADAPGDTVAAHVADTLVAGAGLCDPAAVAGILADGPAAVARLIARGAQFDLAAGGAMVRTREGGHHTDRIIHAGGDATGAEIERALSVAQGPAVLTEHLAVDVALDETGAAAGVHVLDPDGRMALIQASAVVLATGGSGQLYAASTNPAVATADGLAMALRTGAALADVEFVQFHPTALWTGEGIRGRRPLVTEALRGAGAVLLDGAGRRVMAGVHPLADLAPRDVVSLAITRRLARTPGGIGDHVFLDARSVDRVVERFPSVSASCFAIGVDPRTDLIPVSPAAHYHCGGVWTDFHGETTVPGLFAAGEVARTGLHGANRLASNSLLEGLVMGERVAAAVVAGARVGALREPAGLDGLHAFSVSPADRQRLQDAMSRHAGIGRDSAGLAAAAAVAEVAAVSAEPAAVDVAGVEATNLAQVSAALLAAAAERRESRGCHVRTDFRRLDAAQAQSLFVRWEDGRPVVSSELAAPREAALAS